MVALSSALTATAQSMAQLNDKIVEACGKEKLCSTMHLKWQMCRGRDRLTPTR